MDSQEYAALLGQVIVNLQALEYLLRAFLYANADPSHSPLPPGKTPESYVVGEEVPVNALTDYDSLSRLISRYNRAVRASHRHLLLDPSVVELRDALAHGRVSADHPGDNPVLVKFQKPSGGRTKVAYSQKLTRGWMKAQVKLALGECKKVAQAAGTPVTGPWPFA